MSTVRKFLVDSGALAFAVLASAVVACGTAGAQPATELEKPVAPFTLEAEAVAPPTVGVPVDVRVTVTSRAELEDIEVRLSADPGLSVDPSGLTLFARAITPGEPAEWVIGVVPLEEGAQRLRLFGEARIDGLPQARSAVATIVVAGAAGAERESGGQGAQPSGQDAERGADGPERASAVLRETAPGARRKSGAAVDTAREGTPAGTERVIRLPASERP